MTRLRIVLVTGLLFGAVSAGAGIGDGTLVGVTTLLDSGDPAGKIDIVFVGDGFKANQQDTFNERVESAANAFLAAHPYDALGSALNIHRVNVASRESGTDVPATCPDGTNSTARSVATAMDTSYCQGDVFRCVGTPNGAAVTFWTNNAPGSDFVIVLVNDDGYGGCAFGSRTFETLDDSLNAVVIHEMGHALGDLGDEYTDDDPGFSTRPAALGEPRAVNLTVNTDRATLKWGDLVLASTEIPTERCAVMLAGGGGCSPSYPSGPYDLVGAYEGGDRFYHCGVFRPSAICRMDDHNYPYCSVCRRRLIQRLRPSLSRSLAVTFRQLLVRDDQDGWLRGAGDIFFNYQLAAGGSAASGRWPGADGDVGFDSGDEKSLDDFFAGSISEPAAGGSGSIAVQVRDSDWPDGDDTLADDAVATFASPAPATFTIDQADYRLQGALTGARLKVLFDMITIKDDQDDASDGDIYIKYTISNGALTVSGRWPGGDGDVGIGSNESREIGILAGEVPEPAQDGSLTVHVEVWDADSFLLDGDDTIGEDTFTYGPKSGFGAGQIVHVEDRDNYRLTLSVVAIP